MEYLIGKKTTKEYFIAAFKDGEKSPNAVYTVSKKRAYSCDCPGFRRQKDKSAHKHIKLVEFWKNNLEEQDGFALWFDGDNIEYHKFI